MTHFSNLLAVEIDQDVSAKDDVELSSVQSTRQLKKIQIHELYGFSNRLLGFHEVGDVGSAASPVPQSISKRSGLEFSVLIDAVSRVLD
jgi:hypothetical protein